MSKLATKNSAYNPCLIPQILAEDLIKLPTLEAAVFRVAEIYNFRNHPYLIWMQAATTQREMFRHSQLPFRFAVESFSQALAAVLARIPQVERRLALLENLIEEHGHGDRDRTHKSTFRQYLLALGATPSELETPCTTPVLAFNQSILNFCLTQSSESGAALLGMIEYLYVDISNAIAKTILERHWVIPGSQSHYAIHAELDVSHAKDLLALAQSSWTQTESRFRVAQALTLGAYYFWSLYRDLQLIF